MTKNKRFKLHIEWYNKEKTDGEATLYERGQPLGVIESIEDARLIRNILNELNDENEQLKERVKQLQINNTERLQNEIEMLKTTIARNEAYIHQLTSKGEWRK